MLSHVRLFATPWTVAHQAPLSMKFSRQEYWSGYPFPSPGDLPNPRIEPRSPVLQVDYLPAELSVYIGALHLKNNNVGLVSGVQQTDSVIHVSIIFQIPFPFSLLQNTK